MVLKSSVALKRCQFAIIRDGTPSREVRAQS